MCYRRNLGGPERWAVEQDGLKDGYNGLANRTHAGVLGMGWPCI
jgi:hypothetical protein